MFKALVDYKNNISLMRGTMYLVMLHLSCCFTATVGHNQPPDILTEILEMQAVGMYASVGVNMCNHKCTHRPSCRSFGYDSDNLLCYLLPLDKTEECARFVYVPKGNAEVQAESCSQKTCQGVRCLKTFTGNVVCVPEKENKQPSMTQPNTNFMRACMDGVQCGVKLLLSGGQADINTRDILRRTPVMFAAMRAYKDMFHLLVREGADLSSVDQDQNTILHTACEGGNLNIVKYILNENIVDVDSRNFDNMTPIMKSALNGHADVFDGLVEKGADLLLVDHYHSTILHFASLGGSVDIVDRILRVDRVNINSTDNQHRTPVMIAASKGHKDVFDLLVSKGADLTLNDDNDTILYAACQGGNIEIVKYVLGQDVSYINTRGSEGFTPVLLAAFNGYWEVFHFLLLKEASLSVRPDSGENILHVACIGGNLKIVKYVLKQNTEDINSRGTEGMTPAMRAACCGHKDVFDLLVKKGADLSLVDSNENNILHMACAGGNKELIKYVIAKDIVDINSRSKQGTTPVIGAALIGYKELLHLLSINGADMATTDETGSSILHLALLQHEGETARYIITQDFVNINDTNYQGMTPVLLAVVNGYADVFALLVRKGASLSSVDASGDNILQNACDGGNADIVKYLLTVKDIVHDINRKGKAGLTPVMVAARSGNKGVFDLLVKNGAELTQVDDDGNTILHLACTANVQIVKYLLSHNTVDINTRGAYGRTPLLTTARSGNRLAFDELLKKGADTSMKDNEDNNILHLATEQGYVVIVRYILSQAIVDLSAKNKHGSKAAELANVNLYPALKGVLRGIEKSPILCSLVALDEFVKIPQL